MNINAFAAPAAKTPLQPYEYKMPNLGPGEVLVRTEYCGICHSDLHMINNDWGISSYPLVPGHEVVGIVEQKAKDVQHLKVNQRVGIGWQSSACLVCDSCVSGSDNLCSQQAATCVGRHGGFASHVVVHSHYAFPIPEQLSALNCAPLLCGGITVFSPLLHFNVKPTMRVGVIGIGGLGHLALRFLRAWGCEVIAFSSSADKAAEAAQLGAHDFCSSTDHKALRSFKNKLDFVISTVNVDLEWTSFMSCLAADGKLCLVGVPPDEITVPAGVLLEGRKSLTASPIGSRISIRHMLNFAARHQIMAQTEEFPLSEVNTALAKLSQNKIRFRAVLKV